MNPPRVRRAVEAYLDAKRALLDLGYESEIDWQASLRPTHVNESTFLSETAWVILNAGFREQTVRRLFPSISDAFLQWEGSMAIYQRAGECVSNALSVFNNRPKIQAIAGVAELVARRGGFSTIWKRISADPLSELLCLPFIGPTTSFHLAKNLGFDVAKPDRHLQRISQILCFSSPTDLCQTIAGVVGDRASVVDLVFWRHATLFQDYQERLGGAA